MSNLIPMLAITGNPTKEEIDRQILEFSQVGFGGVLIYPRDGCEIEYLSEAWLDLCGFVIQACETYGMHVWLYDEFNWPSGSCKNRVQKADFRFWGKCLAMGASGLEIKYKNICADLLEPASVECFIQLTHERYRLRFERYFGNVIQGMFTDEPSFAYSCEGNEIPFYAGMELDYQKTQGGDLFADAPAALNGQPVNGFWKTIYDLLGQRMKRVYLGRIAAWCKTHGLICTGHLLADELGYVGIQKSGNPLHVLEEIPLPGVDDINTKVDDKMLETYALPQYLTRKRHCSAMIELFALGPCNMPFATQRRSIWLAAMHGIDHYFIAVAHLDPKGNIKKKDWFNPQCGMQPWFHAARLLAADAQRAAAYAQKPYQVQVFVRNPREAMLLAMENGGEEAVREVELQFQRLLRTLLHLQVTWCLADEADPAQQPILCVDRRGWYLGEALLAPGELESWAAQRLGKRTMVLAENGRLAENVLVRTLEDGSAVVIDCADQIGAARPLWLHRNGKSQPFVLEGHGVFLSKEERHELQTKGEIHTAFKVEYRQEGWYRPFLTRPEQGAAFIVEKPVVVQVLARSYPTAVRVTLDGAEIMTPFPSGAMPQGFAPVYQSSRPILLEPGTHTIWGASQEGERLYLPSALLRGDITVRDNRIFPRPRQYQAGAPLSFYGTARFTTKVAVPREDALFLKLDPHHLACKVWLDDCFLGEGIFAPYRFPVPDVCKGRTAVLAIEQTTSIAPLFGIIDQRAEEETGLEGWCSGCGSRPDTCGFEGLAWVTESKAPASPTNGAGVSGRD